MILTNPMLAGWRTSSVRRWAWAVVFCAAYVALDWASYIDPFHGLNVTPWNPAPALGILYLLAGGVGGPLTLVAALVAGDMMVRELTASVPAVLILDLLLAVGYAGIAVMLKRHTPEGGIFSDRTNLANWMAIVVLGSLANSLIFVSGLALFNLISAADWDTAVLKFWVGDGVGIFVTFPLLWWLQDKPKRHHFARVLMRWETLGYLALVSISLYVAFLPDPNGQLKYLYILFLPLVLAASRQGLIGAVFCASLLQLGMLLAGWMAGAHGASVFELQMRSLMLAAVGFLMGVAVDEQRRAVQDLRHTLRLAAAGEMAAALAHELNQPITALLAYGSAIEHLLRSEGGSEQLRQTVHRMVSESGRAAEVVRRLRDFFRTGSTHLEMMTLAELIGAAVKPFRDKAPTMGIELTTATVPSARLHVDGLQIEVVLRNLLSNAFDAVSGRPSGRRAVSITFEPLNDDLQSIRIEDTGPGIAGPMVEGAFEPFVTTKSSGLGLGLAISRAIAEAHGGRLVAHTGNHGCFILSLPVEASRDSNIG